MKDMRKRRMLKGLAWMIGLYVLAWVGYSVKSSLGIDLLPYHVGGIFPGAPDRAV